MSKRIVVTGAAGGMGLAACRQLAARGAHVLAVDRNADGLQKLKEELSGSTGEILTFAADLQKLDDVNAYVDLGVKSWGGLDGAFHLAGVAGELSPFVEADIEDFDLMMALNARHVWYGMKALVPLFLKQGGGVIVNTGSYVANRGGRFISAYAAAKHAVVGLTRCVAIEYASSNIRVNVICPDSTDTPMARSMATRLSPDDIEAGLRIMSERIPRKQMAMPEEVSEVGVWLLLDAPAHLSGQVIPVDGARSAG